mmetsp:Transcript_31716/g.94463  ORF Transcript_31716/g.94463 Transcript_31716/m.94463 type:complete len:136 (+) Transcript_31716:47-454(+)
MPPPPLSTEFECKLWKRTIKQELFAWEARLKAAEQTPKPVMRMGASGVMYLDYPETAPGADVGRPSSRASTGSVASSASTTSLASGPSLVSGTSRQSNRRGGSRRRNGGLAPLVGAGVPLRSRSEAALPRRLAGV